MSAIRAGAGLSCAARTAARRPAWQAGGRARRYRHGNYGKDRQYVGHRRARGRIAAHPGRTQQPGHPERPGGGTGAGAFHHPSPAGAAQGRRIGGQGSRHEDVLLRCRIRAHRLAGGGFVADQGPRRAPAAIPGGTVQRNHPAVPVPGPAAPLHHRQRPPRNGTPALRRQGEHAAADGMGRHGAQYSCLSAPGRYRPHPRRGRPVGHRSRRGR